ncbi:MAG: hypothetical protein KatS3mg131_3866 [Candidatus Tectimicrobiota bacterium]|nr:MAG: hypothetical protein KatS3mg131_3866 [Candidatus Tectomicrobia bacterium]
MTPEELARREAAAHAQVAALRALAETERATPGFAARVLAAAGGVRPRRAAALPVPAGLLVLLGLALLGAVPQYLAWFQALRLKVPPAAVAVARLQEQLWQRNFACAGQLDARSGNYAALTTEAVVVVVWACPSGDVLLTVESPAGAFPRRSLWIAHDDPLLRQGLATLWPRLLPVAQAAEKPRRPAPMVRVLCQRWLPRRLVWRHVQLADGRCQEEVVNPRTGRVVQRRLAPCALACGPPGRP